MTLIKTSLLSFIATVIKLLSGLVINKAVAVYIGPSGLALIGQFQSFSQIALTVARGGILSGVVKFTAEFANKGSLNQSLLFGTASRICLFSSIVVGSLVAAFSEQLAISVLHDESYAYVFIMFALSLVFFVLNGLLLSLLNGLKEIKTYISINIIQSFYALIFTTILIVYWGLDGALIALVTNQSVIFLVVLVMLRKHPEITFARLTQGYSSCVARKLFGYSAMALVTAISIPISHILIRNHIGDTIGWDEAGYWQAIWYISTMYLMVVTTTLNIYYLPKLSELTEPKEIRHELKQGYKIIMPIVIVVAASIYFLRDFIVVTLFSNDFLEMKQLFLYQLIGDVIKLFSWLMAYLFLAKAMTKVFIAFEIMFSVFFVSSSFLFIDAYGLIGVTYAFSLSYLIYTITVYFMVRHIWRENI